MKEIEIPLIDDSKDLIDADSNLESLVDQGQTDSPPLPDSTTIEHVAQDLVAGTVGGILQVIAGHPLDTVKVRLQTQRPIDASSSHHPSPHFHPSANRSYNGLTDCIRSIWREEGPRGFYKGMGSPLFGMAFLNALLFATYAESSKYFLRQNNGEPLSLAQQTMSGAVAGLVQCIVVGPTELVKARLQVQAQNHPTPQQPLTHPSSPNPTHPKNLSSSSSSLSSSTSASFSSSSSSSSSPLQHSRNPTTSLFYNGPLDCVRKTYALQGFRGLLSGMSGTIYREIPAYALMFASYEAIKDLLIPHAAQRTLENEILDHGVIEHDIEHSMYPGRLVLAGGIAGVLCWTISYPQDVVLNRLRVQPIDRPAIYKKHPLLLDGGFVDCAKKLVKNEGWRTLFRGYTACLIRAFPANAASFLGYEMVKSIWHVKKTN